jgi:RNA polymerase sigma factor (sigma-70 family)
VPPQDIETARWFDQEVRPHATALRAWLRAQFPSLMDPDDLVQESYLRLLRARNAGKIANAKAFLYTTARNVALDLVRRNRVAPTESLVSEAASFVTREGTDVAEHACRAQEIEILHEAIRSLPDRCREIMTLQRIHGLSNRQIADRLGLSIHTINAQMVIGLMRCRNYLKERGVLGNGQG